MNRPSRLLPVVAGLALLSLLAGCGAGRKAPSSPASGVSGVTRVDGGCPMAKDSSPCPDRPIAAHLKITASAGAVTTVTTGPDGHFTVPLPPGDYQLHATNTSGGPVPLAAPQSFTVVTGRVTNITVAFDSGIR